MGEVVVAVMLPCWYFVSNGDELRRKNIKPISTIYSRNIYALNMHSECERAAVVVFVWLGDKYGEEC